VLVIVSGLPRVGAVANEDLDLLLVAAAFDLDPAVLFTADGVHHLVRAADPPGLGRRDVGRAYEALPTYDVGRVFVDSDALARAGLDAEQLSLGAAPLDSDGVRALIAAHDVVFTA
jgi:tRNA 2-thiouridine synthesizing protein C